MPDHDNRQSRNDSSLSYFVREFRPRHVVPALTAGLIVGVIATIIEISLAALLFSGDMAPYLANGVGLMLFGSSILTIVAALTSSQSSTVIIPQDTTTAIMALLATAISRDMATSAAASTRFSTVIVGIAITSLMTGAFFLVAGRFHLGRLIRFIPYPVVGGFLAGTGWLLIQGSVGVMAKRPLSFVQLASLFQPDVLALWVPGLIFAVLLLFSIQRFRHFLVIPAIVFGCIALFYGLLWLTKTPVADARARGWLPAAFGSRPRWSPITLVTLTQVNWSVVFGQLDKIAAAMMIAVISLLLNVTGLELAMHQDIDLNRELKAAGIANLLAGLGASPSGYTALSLSMLGHQIGSGSRLVGLCAGAVCGVVLIFGASLVALVPTAVIGGILMFLGLTFMIEWLYETWGKVPRLDYCLILVILVIVGTAGFLPGVIAGLLITIVVFVVNYSRINVVKHALSGTNYRSRVTRDRQYQQLLHEKGEQLYILQLQGFLFFGTAHNLLVQLHTRIDDRQLPPLRFIVLDFRQVTGLDSTAMMSFAKLWELAQAHGITLALTHLAPQIQAQFAQRVLDGEQHMHVFLDLDHGLAWCEDQLLLAAGEINAEQQTLHEQLQAILPQSDTIADLMKYLERQHVEAGHYLMHQGDSADEVYFIESGQITAQIEQAGYEPVRLETMRGGHIVGEIGFYQGKQRTAAVVADEPSTIYRLTTRDLRRMEAEEPQAAFAFHQIIVHLLAERTAHLINTVDALER